MSKTSTLPAVEFAERGKVTAAEAVVVDGDGVYVLHPEGGRIYVTAALNPANAAADLQGVLTAWAKLSAEFASR